MPATAPASAGCTVTPRCSTSSSTRAATRSPCALMKTGAMRWPGGLPAQLKFVSTNRRLVRRLRLGPERVHLGERGFFEHLSAPLDCCFDIAKAPLELRVRH